MIALVNAKFLFTLTANEKVATSQVLTKVSALETCTKSVTTKILFLTAGQEASPDKNDFVCVLAVLSPASSGRIIDSGATSYVCFQKCNLRGLTKLHPTISKWAIALMGKERETE